MPSDSGIKQPGLKERPADLIAGQYQRLALLGEGAFGKVWRVKDAASGRELALKEMKRADDGSVSEKGSAEVAQQVEQEFISLAKLEHPNIVRVFDYGILEDKSRYLVMELVSGRDLAELVKEAPLDIDEALRVLIALAQALDLMHSRLFVHCDIKSENVRVTDKGDVKLMDFGLLHQLGIASTQVRGTVQYMAPEVFTGGVIDARTDLYSVGVLAYELITGQLPYRGSTHAEILRQHLSAPIPEPSDLVDIPEEIDVVVKRLMAKAPADRFANAAELVRALAAIRGVDVEHDTTHRTSYLYSAELIGRDEESAFLDDVRAGLSKGTGASVYVAGRAGEGKSRLLAELSLKARLEGHLWTVGRCQKEGLGPLQPMVEALAPIVGRSSDDMLRPYGDVLSTIIPHLRNRGFSPPTFASPFQAKVKLHEAASGWLRAFVAEHPFLLCVEDLHWADGGTIELLNHLIRDLHDAPLVLIGTFRLDEVERTSAIYATVDEGLTVNLALRPLRRRDVGKLLTSTLAQHDVPNEFVSRLYETTGGNAFFTVETLRYLVEAELLRRPEQSWLLAREDAELPPTIADVVTKRLETLPSELLALCRALSPLGLALDTGLARTISGLDGEGFVERMERLVERQFLQRISGRYHFTHQTVRDAVYAQLAGDERARLHKRLGELMEAHAKDDPTIEPSQLAYHFNLAGESDRAIRYFLDAGLKALKTVQHFDATSYLRQGAELVEKVQPKNKDELLLRYYDALANVALSGHPPSLIKASERLWEVWSRRVDPEKHAAKLRAGDGKKAGLGGLLSKLRAKPAAKSGPFDPLTKDADAIFHRMLQVKGGQAMALSVLGEPERSLEVSEHTLSLLPDPKSIARGMLLCARCIALTHLGRYNEIIEASEQAVDIFENTEVPLHVTYHWAIAHYFTALGRSLKGLPVGREQIERACEIGDKYLVLDAKGFALWAAQCHYTLSGKPEGFEEYLTEIQGLSRRLGYPFLLESRSTTMLPIYYIDRGQFELARAAMDKLERLGKKVGDSWMMTYAYVYRGLDSMEMGQLDEAAVQLENAVKLARERRLGRLTTALCGLGQVLAKKGDQGSARTLLEEVLERSTSREFECHYDEIVARRLLADVTPPDEAGKHLERAIDLARETDNPLQEGIAWLTLSRQERAAGRDAATAKENAREKLLRVKNEYWLKRLEAV